MQEKMIKVKERKMDERTDFWKIFPDYPQYRINSLGKIKSLRQRKEKILNSVWINGKEYYRVRNDENKARYFSPEKLRSIYYDGHYDAQHKIKEDVKVGKIRLNDSQIASIINLVRFEGKKQKEVAKLFNISESTVSTVLLGKTRKSQQYSLYSKQSLVTKYHLLVNKRIVGSYINKNSLLTKIKKAGYQLKDINIIRGTKIKISTKINYSYDIA